MEAWDFGVLLLRVVLGLTMAAHGYNKFFGGGRIKGTAGWFESIGMKPGTFHARMAATTEMAAGIGLAVGLFTPVTAVGFVALMLVGIIEAHVNFVPAGTAWTTRCSGTPTSTTCCTDGVDWSSRSASVWPAESDSC